MIIGSPKSVLAQYRAFCEAAHDQFYSKHWPCEVTDQQGNRCCNLKAGHPKGAGHQISSGKRFAVFESHRKEQDTNERQGRDIFLEDIMRNLETAIGDLKASSHEFNGSKEERKAVHSLHINKTLSSYVKAWELTTSHTTCLCCLAAVPEHAIIKCGHFICHDCCISSSSETRPDLEREIGFCPVCSKILSPPMKIAIKPRSAGLRILSLDGYIIKTPY